MNTLSETQVTFRLPRSLVQRLRRLAARTGQKRSALVRRAVEMFLEVAEAGSVGGRARSVQHLLGAFDTGIPDLAQRHSEFLKLLRKP